MSKIQVDAVEQQSGTTVTVGGGACKTVTVDATTVTLGRSGATVSLAPGASQTGFGRTGTVDWCTTAKTSPFTAVSGDGFFVNTTSGAVTVTLPASPSAGDIVAVKDYAGTAGCNAITIGRNGSKIRGECSCATLNQQNAGAQLIYVDGTEGWQIFQCGSDDDSTATFVQATGGTILTSGNFKTHVFTASGCFQVTSVGNALGSSTLDYVVVAGGGSSGGDNGGGGGAGGFRMSNGYSFPSPTTSPLASGASLPAAIQTYPVTVGAGGASAGTATGNSGPPGADSVFSTITSAGGGAAAEPSAGGSAGGSGGGGFYNNNPAGAGNTPPVSPPQGNPGGTSAPGGGSTGGGGGGGAGAAAANVNPGDPGSAGGIGSFISDSLLGPTAPSYGEPGPVSNTRYFAGGGGGGMQPGPTTGNNAKGGIGGGGDAFKSAPYEGQNGIVNTGGGAGGGNPGTDPPLNPTASTSGVGGSGIVMITYKFQ